MKNQHNQAQEKMKNRVQGLDNEFRAIRAGRANPAVLDKIFVDYYGTPTPINQMAAISVSEARVLVIQPWDASALQLIEKAINMSDLGISPNNDGKLIRLAFPQLTQERRKELTKDIGKYAEEAKISIRNIRREVLDALKTMKKDNQITEDELKTAEKDVQVYTDKFIKEIDELAKEKEKEILEI